MDAWRRAIHFMRRIDERVAEHIVPVRWGRALVDRRFNLVHDANYLPADRLDDADADAIGLIAEAERIHRASCAPRARTSQVEIVETLEAYRGRGYARAIVSAAIQAAPGEDFVFLVTDIDDGPQQLYRRRGFDDIGIESRFLRLVEA